MDKGHVYTDKELKRLERRFKKAYSQAEKEVQAKLTAHLKKFEAKDVIMRQKLADGSITAEQYKYWRTGQIMTGKQWQTVRDGIALRYTNAHKETLKAINDSMLDVYAENINYSTFAIESFTGVNTAFQMYDASTVRRLLRDEPNLLPLKKVDGRGFTTKVERWNRQKVSSAVLQGVIQGEGSAKIAKRLKTVTNMDMRSSVLNARTALTSAESAGRLDAYTRASELGIDTQKQWIATHDGRTRHTHRQVDGEIVPLKEQFSNGCKYPADPLAEPAETYNCRCRIVPVVDGQGIDMPDTANGMNYEEWKNEKARYNGVSSKNDSKSTRYKTFENGDAANKYFGQHPPSRLRRENRAEYDKLRAEYEDSAFYKFNEKLTAKQSRSIAEYSADGYSGINGLLRGQMTEKMVASWDAFGGIPIESMIIDIETAIDGFELAEPIRVFRTCEDDIFEKLKLEVGSTFRDDGFCSTSVLSKKVASGNVVLEIDVPSGKGFGAWINPLSGAQDEEYEFLLQRGSEFVVKGYEKKGDDIIVRLGLTGSNKKKWKYATRESVIARMKRLGIYDESILERI